MRWISSGFQFDGARTRILDALLNGPNTAQHVRGAVLGCGPCDRQLGDRTVVLLGQVCPAGKHVEQALPVLEFEPGEPSARGIAEVVLPEHAVQSHLAGE